MRISGLCSAARQPLRAVVIKTTKPTDRAKPWVPSRPFKVSVLVPGLRNVFRGDIEFDAHARESHH